MMGTAAKATAFAGGGSFFNCSPINFPAAPSSIANGNLERTVVPGGERTWVTWSSIQAPPAWLTGTTSCWPGPRNCSVPVRWPLRFVVTCNAQMVYPGSEEGGKTVTKAACDDSSHI